MTQRADLIAKLEAAKRGSRELNYEIWRLIAANPDDPVHHRRNSRTYSGLPYTTSLDAALTLVPDGWRGITIETTQAGFWLASLSPVFQTQPVNYPCYGSIAYTAPLAVVAAILKARKETP